MNKLTVKELGAILCLLEVKGIGPVKFKNIFNKLHSFYHVFDVSEETLKYDFNFKDSIVRAISKQKNNLNLYMDKAIGLLNDAELLNAKIITFFDKEYPPNLFESNHSVPILYVLGKLSLLKERKCCAVVGTRKPNIWTKNQTIIAVKNLIQQGYTIVSGLALGIDAIAHSTTLNNFGRTIAVLGCGIDIIYPKENQYLRDRIARECVIISEYPFGTRVREFALKKRNKITVGVSQSVLITQTSDKGGTMNAYRAAIEQKKTVGIFLPPNGLEKEFSGNLKILNENKVRILKFSNPYEIEFSERYHDKRFFI